MVSVLVFDLRGVVFHFDPRRRLRLMAAASPLSELEVDGALWGSGLSADADRGLYDAREQVVESQTRARLALDYGQMRDVWVSAFDPSAEVIGLLDRLRPALTVASLSNNSELIRFGLQHHWPELMARFRPSLWSHQAGELKPAPGVFDYARRRLGTQAAEICLVDDDEENVAAARAAGWDALRFTDVPSLEVALQERGLLGVGPVPER
jgi:glucose-1-phosphatase